MIIRKYGVDLRRIRKSDLELVRQMRNSKPIRARMFFQEEISKEQQLEWFRKNFNIYNYYFIIEYKGKKIGLIDGKNVNYEMRTSEGGLFIWDLDYWESFVPVLASVMLTDFTFVLCNFKKINAQVLDTNTRTLHYNAQFGFQLDTELSTPERNIYSLTREDYFQKGRKVRDAVMKIGKDSTPLSWEDIFFEDISQEERKHLYTGLPEDIQKELDRRIG